MTIIIHRHSVRKAAGGPLQKLLGHMTKVPYNLCESTSRSARYSRVRYWAFGSRPGETVLFTVLGALARDLDFIDNFPCAHPFRTWRLRR
jgi:hypothetical protein